MYFMYEMCILSKEIRPKSPLPSRRGQKLNIRLHGYPGIFDNGLTRTGTRGWGKGGLSADRNVGERCETNLWAVNTNFCCRFLHDIKKTSTFPNQIGFWIHLVSKLNECFNVFSCLINKYLLLHVNMLINSTILLKPRKIHGYSSDLTMIHI